MVADIDPAGEYGRKVGERLRAIRRQKRMSLQEVEAASNHEFKASVLGAYERGERAISVPRLQRLARFYSVPVDQLLPGNAMPDFGRGRDEVIDLTDSTQAKAVLGSITIDLTKLETLSGPESDMLNRYLSMIQVQRQDFNGRVLTIRRQKRMSLQEVEAASNHEFKASVLGAYERGERAISVPRLQRLARFYSVPVDQLLPGNAMPDFGRGTGEVIDLTDRTQAKAVLGSITIDLTRLETLSGPEADMLNRYLSMIQVQRQDFNGRVLTIRGADLQAIAAILGTDVESAPNRLGDLGLRRQPNN